MSVTNITPEPIKVYLNTDGRKPTEAIRIKQGTLNSVYLEIFINDKGGVMEFPEGTTGKFKMLKPDGKQINNPVDEVRKNSIIVYITQQMWAVSGQASAEIILLHKSQSLPSATFDIYIVPSVHDDGQIESKPEYKTLLNALTKIEDAIPKAEEAHQVAQEANALLDSAKSKLSGYDTAEQNRKTAEQSRVNAEAQRQQAETNRVNTFNAFMTDISQQFQGKYNDITLQFNGKYNDITQQFKGKYDDISQQFQTKYDNLEVEYSEQLTEAKNNIDLLITDVTKLQSQVDLAVIDTQTGTGFVQTTVADEGMPVEIVIEGKTVVTPLDPTQDISPDNPATITSVGDEPFDVVCYGKNLVSSATYASARQYHVSVFALVEDLLPESKYTISLNIPNGERYYLNEYLFENGAKAIVTGDGTRKTVTATTLGNFSKNDTEVYEPGKGWKIFKNHTGYTSAGTASGLQIELGLGDGIYEPYKGSNKITISSPLRSVPDTDICDTLEIFSNGKARYTQRIGMIVFDGSADESWAKVEELTDFVRFNIADISNAISVSGRNNRFSDMFKYHPYSTVVDFECLRYHSSANTLTLIIKKDRLSSYNVTGLRAWLAEHPITYYYELAEPIVTETQYTTLITYKGITNILTTSQVQPNITAKFYSRLGNFAEVIMARLDKITQALLALGGTA